jgi:hypothetical protein
MLLELPLPGNINKDSVMAVVGHPIYSFTDVTVISVGHPPYLHHHNQFPSIPYAVRIFRPRAKS